MEVSESSEIYDKKELRNHLLDLIISKQNLLERYMKTTKEANIETKRSGGTTWETQREHLAQELIRVDLALYNVKNLRHNMRLVQYREMDTVTIGSVIITNKARFYISVGYGEFFFQGTRFYAITAESPLGKFLKGKKPGDEFVFFGISQKILSIY